MFPFPGHGQPSHEHLPAVHNVTNNVGNQVTGHLSGGIVASSYYSPPAIRRRPMYDTSGPCVFINYRQHGGHASAVASIHHAMQQRFGAARVFFDIHSMAPGTRYPDELWIGLERSKVLIAVIHHGWLAELRARQAAAEPDWVLHEIRTALRSRKVVLPVLLDDAPLPAHHELPAEIQDLARRQACRLRWQSLGEDLRALVTSAERHLAAD